MLSTVTSVGSAGNIEVKRWAKVSLEIPTRAGEGKQKQAGKVLIVCAGDSVALLIKQENLIEMAITVIHCALLGGGETEVGNIGMVRDLLRRWDK